MDIAKVDPEDRETKLDVFCCFCQWGDAESREDERMGMPEVSFFKRIQYPKRNVNLEGCILKVKQK